MQVSPTLQTPNPFDVFNQPPPLADYNIYAQDTALREAVQREGGGWVEDEALAFGAVMGRAETLRLGDLANRYPPVLHSFDRFGHRIDEVEYHPAYHDLMKLGVERQTHALPWTCDRPGAHVARVALGFIRHQVEEGTSCPLTMTFAAVPTLRRQPELAAEWEPRVTTSAYDPRFIPADQKQGAIFGMAMTERQGGSDVRANTTRAEPLGGRLYRLTGHKWFCSAPMSDAFLTLAYAPEGLSCFLVPRITREGERNAIHVMRLKDKLGNKSNASSEIEYHGATAELLGEPGRGVNVIIDMVHHTRLGTIAGTIGIMRMALAEAVHHVSGRRAFQKTLIDQPLMQAVVADLAVEYEAAVALTLSVAAAFDGADAESRAFARLAVAVSKYWLTKRCPNFVYEAMECMGGAGYVEESPLPRLFRESPLNAIWEGSGNVIALDILRTLAREPAARDAFFAELAKAKGADPRLDAAIDALAADLGKGLPPEAEARFVAERMALTLQAALLARHAPHAVADAFLATRLGGQGGRSFGAFPAGLDIAAIVARQRAA